MPAITESLRQERLVLYETIIYAAATGAEVKLSTRDCMIMAMDAAIYRTVEQAVDQGQGRIDVGIKNTEVGDG